MTKADIVSKISERTGIERFDVLTVVDNLMDVIRNSVEGGNNVYLRGFGSFIVKRRAEKIGRNISKNISVVIPAHNIPAFKPSKSFVEVVKKNQKT